jgi:FkbM family methyltransferase
MAGRSSMSGARRIGAGLAALGGVVAWPLGRWHGPRLRAELASRAAPIYRLQTAQGALAFRCTSAEAVKAAARFVYDEPETVWWIDQVVQPGDCVWDVGANVGLYALYAALRLGEGGEVIAFEPGAENYAALCRNVALNPTAASVKCFCVALSDETRAASLHLTSQDAGRAAHVFGRADEGLTAEARPHTQSALGFSADGFRGLFGVRAPDHVKIDVDSIEERIVRGGAEAFAGARSLIVEINIGESGAGHKERLRRAIQELGFVEHAETSARFPDRRNRIFVRDGGR